MGLKNAALPLKERALAEAIGQEFRDALREHREELEHARLVQDAPGSLAGPTHGSSRAGG